MKGIPATTLKFLAVCGSMTIVTGIVGWSRIYGPDPDRDVWDVLYHTALAFVGDGSFIAASDKAQHNVWIRVSRTAGLLTLLSALATVLIALLSDRVARMRVRSLSGHTVVVGVSQFALDLVGKTGTLVLLDDEATLEAIGRQPRSGRTTVVPVSLKDMARIDPLIGTPGEVIFGSPDTTLNVARARSWLAARPSFSQSLKIRIEDNTVARDLELLSDAFRRAKVVSRSEFVARALVTTVAPAYLAALRGQDRVHFALVGCGKTNLAIAEEIILRGHHRALGAPKVTFIDEDISAAKRRIRTERPDLLNPDLAKSGVEIAFLEMNALECCSAQCAADLLDAERACAFTGVVVSAGPEANNLAIAMRLRQLQVERLCMKAPIFARSDSETMAAGPVRDFTSGVVPFGGRALAESDHELERLHEDLAEAIHNRWRASPDVERTKENEWGEMSAGERRASYRAALSAIEMFYEAGFVPPLGDPLAGLRLEPSQANAFLGDSPRKMALSRTEHERWCAERRLEGFVTAPQGVRDNEKKHHDLLVDYDTLLAKKDPVQIQKDVENVEQAFERGIKGQAKHPHRPFWRKSLRIGVMGPLSVDATAAAKGVDEALAKLLKDAPEHAALDLEILTPNAPGFDRVAATALASAWLEQTKRPCRILTVNAARLPTVDAFALSHVARGESAAEEFDAQTRELEGLADAGHRIRTLDLRPPGLSDQDLRNEPTLYDEVLLAAQALILEQADVMIFDTNAGRAGWTVRAHVAWAKTGKTKALVLS